jgi:hypothetical protein
MAFLQQDVTCLSIFSMRSQTIERWYQGGGGGGSGGGGVSSHTAQPAAGDECTRGVQLPYTDPTAEGFHFHTHTNSCRTLLTP